MDKIFLIICIFFGGVIGVVYGIFVARGLSAALFNKMTNHTEISDDLDDYSKGIRLTTSADIDRGFYGGSATVKNKRRGNKPISSYDENENLNYFKRNVAPLLDKKGS